MQQRDLCWLLTRHPEKPEYVVLCVRQGYFDGLELDRLILDARATYWDFASPVKQTCTRNRSPGCGTGSPVTRTAKPCLRTLSGRSWFRHTIAVGEIAIRKPLPCRQSRLASAESSAIPFPMLPHFLINLHGGHSDHVGHNKARDSVLLLRADDLIDAEDATSPVSPA